MNKAEDYASDSEQSDEDFCPEKEIAAGNSASEEEDSETENEIEEENTEVQTKTAKKSRKKTKKCKKHSNKANDEEAAESEDQLEHNKKVTRQSENNGGDGKSVHDKDELESDEDEKTRSDSLWADFLSDVKPVAKNSTETNSEAKTSKTKDKVENGHKNEKPQTRVEKAETTTTNEAVKKVTVTDIFDFAGEEVRVEKTISMDSIKENKVAPTATGSSFALKSAALKRTSGGGGGGGLGSVLNQIGKKKKISVLDKTKLDWSSFKQDEGIDEDLQTYNKGKDGYLERQDFLQRTDLRQFEIEKNLRQTRRH